MLAYAYLVPPPVVLGLGFIACTTYFILSIKALTTNGDQARKAFLYTQIAFGFLTFGLMLNFIGAVLQAANFLPQGSWDYEKVERISLSTAYIREFGDMLGSFSDASTIIALALVDRGIAIVQNGGHPTKGSKIVVVLATTIGAFISGIAITCWALMIHIHVLIDRLDYGLLVTNLWTIQGAITVMTMLYYAALLALTLTFLARFVVGLGRDTTEAGTKSASYFFLAATLFFAIRSGYLLGRWAHLVSNLVTYNGMVYSPGFVIVDPIFGTLPILGTLIVLFYLGKREKNGLRFGEPASPSKEAQQEQAEDSSR